MAKNDIDKLKTKQQGKKVVEEKNFSRFGNKNELENIEVNNPFLEIVSIFMKNKAAVVALFTLLTIILLAIFGPIFYSTDPFEIVALPFLPLFKDGYLLGTDYLGRDVLAGLLSGGRVSLMIGLTAALMSILIGINVGAFAGYYRGFVEEILMRFTEFFQVLPTLMFSMVIVALFGASLEVVTIAIGVVSWTAVARTTRSEFLRIKQLEYVTASKAAGATNSQIMFLVILPNALPPIIVQATLMVGLAILFEAGLAFLGLSDPNVISWGQMIGANRPYILDKSIGVTIPSLTIFITVLSISLIGDGLNDALNPKLRQR